MLRVLVLCALSFAVSSHLRKPSDSVNVEVSQSNAVFKKVADQMRLVADELEKGTVSRDKKDSKDNAENEKFPWWADASVAGSKPNFTQTKTEKAPKDGKIAKKDEKFPWWANASAGNLPNLTQTKTEKAPKEAKDEKFPWWANASAGNLPNLTQTKTKKAPKEAKDVNVTKKNEKFPWWANASAGNLPNLTQTKTNKASKEAKDVNITKKDEKFPWWANASAGNLPNLTQTKTEKVAKRDSKFPWWANATDMPNFTQITKDLPKELPKGQPSFADLGPFGSKEAACDYCFTSHTRSDVVPNCLCTAYDASDGPTMFCTASAAGVKWVAGKDGGCKCVEKNPAQMGQTTCDPF